MSDKKPIIFCDFDGTFAQKDVGYRMFTHFSGGKNQKLVEDWKKGLISSRECLLQEAELINRPLKDIHTFLDNFELMPGAKKFYNLTKENGIPFYIVSDGVDIYINYILNKFNLDEIECYSNRGTIVDNVMHLEFLFDNNDCTRCGSCKGARIIDKTGKDRNHWYVIFIGDGLSDICALLFADLIFARGDLLKYCRDKNINAVEYNDFFDIIDHVRSIGVFTGQ